MMGIGCCWVGMLDDAPKSRGGVMDTGCQWQVGIYDG